MPAEQNKPHIVIVGAGFAGLMAARALANANAQVTVLDRTNHHLFQPLLYQVATAGLSPAHIASPIRYVLRNQRNTDVLLGEVSGIDRDSRKVLLCDGESVSYHYLILATGAKYNYFAHPEWEDNAPSLKSLSDAVSIRQDILLAFEAAEKEKDAAKRATLLTFVLVGGGPTGVELAGSIAELAHQALKKDFRHIDPSSTRIILLEGSPRILAAFPEELSSAAQRQLQKLGVEVRTGEHVSSIDGQVVTVGTDCITSANILWTAGVVASPVGKWLGIETDKAGRIAVGPDLSAPGMPDTFVLGDAAHVEQDGQLLPGVCPVAMQQGTYVGRLLANRISGRADRQPFHYHDKGNVATVGRSFAIVDLGKIRLSGFLAWILWLFIHIWYLIGFRSKISVMFQWAYAYFTWQRTARLITGPIPQPCVTPVAKPLPLSENGQGHPIDQPSHEIKSV